MAASAKSDNAKAAGAPAAAKSESAGVAKGDTEEAHANAPVEKVQDDAGKFKTFLGILRNFIGVSDLAAVRFSLPAQLLEPTPNLEYWGYLDRPETFVSIGDSEDHVGRMLGTLRFWFTKDLKYVKGKPCKPYNSTLGEFFRCTWEIDDTLPEMRHPRSAPQSSANSVKSNVSAANTASAGSAGGASLEVPGAGSGQKIRLAYLTEQTSHHPPVSAFWIDCPDKGIIARGYDHLAAKFTGTSIRVTAGSHNLGIFITLLNRDNEEYQLTHPAAHLGGLLRGSLSVSVADSCFITCPKTKLKVILEYLEEGWLGRAQNRVQGAIYTYDPATDKRTKVKEIPESDIIARIEGCWMDKVYYTLGPEKFEKNKEKNLLIDLNPLFPTPKTVPPTGMQNRNESRRYWEGVTKAIVNKQYGLATTLKQELEEKQREKAKERKDKGVEWKPRFFTGAVTPVGRPSLTPEGEEALRRLSKGDFKLEEQREYGAF